MIDLSKRIPLISKETTAYRLVNEAGDHLPGLTIDKLGDFLLIQSASYPKQDLIDALHTHFPTAGLYYKNTTPHVRAKGKQEANAQHILGPQAPSRFLIRENDVAYQLSLSEGYSYGIFLDQRMNRKSILDMDLRHKTVLNTFSYTCAFSVCAAKAGATVTSLDLSKKYLEWGRENFRANNIDDTQHDFIFGDVFEWLPRFAKKGRSWDMIILDPPTFSTGKLGRLFKTNADYPQLLTLAKSVLSSNGTMLLCINTHNMSIEKFKTLVGTSRINPTLTEFPNLKSAWITDKLR
ncbi:MAG: hypothetical protein COV45_03830 [Deltaproteobacteria bacterium CG11_big_fil_rev_8_21_14_0_20_47_16]|nr:MAG: hypothetical protein COV45_03830 [Deltaproteobacteria bacterium CG11_big_fil_rev_8_21_14_0_20_47_16]